MTRTKSSRALLSVVLAVLMAAAFMPSLTYSSFAATAKKATKVTKASHADKAKFTRTVGTAWTLKYKLSPSKLTSSAKKVTWKSSNSKVAKITTIKSGKAVVSFKSAGTATVTVATKANPNAKTSWKFKVVNKKAVKKVAATGVTVKANNSTDYTKALKVGTTLTATVAPTDATGVTYQWYADDQPISGATGSEFTVTTDQIGKTVSVKAKANTGAEVTSAASAKVDAVVLKGITLNKATTDTATGKTVYTTTAGDANVGDTLKVFDSQDKEQTGDLSAAASIQWYRVTQSANKSTVETAISGATDATYKVTKEDIGAKIKVVVTPKANVTATGLTNGTYSASTNEVTGYATVEIQANGKKVTTAATNTALTAVVTPSDASVSYQWYNVTDGKDIAIKDATSATYTPTKAGKYAVVIKTTKDEKNYTTTSASRADVTVGSDKLVDVVIKDSNNKAVTEVAAGQTVTATARAIGVTGTADYQWYKNGTKIDGKTSADFKIPTDSKVGDVYKVVATGTGDYAGTSVEASVTVKTLGSITDVTGFKNLSGEVTTNPVTGNYVLNVKNLPAKDWILNKDYTVEFYKLVKNKSNGTISKVSLGKATATTAQDADNVMASYELTDSDTAVGTNEQITGICASVTGTNYTGEQIVEFKGVAELLPVTFSTEASKDGKATNLKVNNAPSGATFAWKYNGVAQTNATTDTFYAAKTYPGTYEVTVSYLGATVSHTFTVK